MLTKSKATGKKPFHMHQLCSCDCHHCPMHLWDATNVLGYQNRPLFALILEVALMLFTLWSSFVARKYCFMHQSLFPIYVLPSMSCFNIIMVFLSLFSPVKAKLYLACIVVLGNIYLLVHEILRRMQWKGASTKPTRLNFGTACIWHGSNRTFFALHSLLALAAFFSVMILV